MKTTNQLIRTLKQSTLSFVMLALIMPGFAEKIPSEGMNKTIYRSLNRCSFVENKGQVHQDCAYFVRASSAFIYILNNGDIVYSSEGKGGVLDAKDNFIEHIQATKTPTILPLSENNAFVHEYVSSNNEIQHFKSGKFENLVFEDVFDGISMDLIVQESTIEKRFIVGAFANPNQIKISLAGSIPCINEAGELLLHSKSKEIMYSKPFAYQSINGVNHIVDVAYKVTENAYGFEVGDYDKTKELIIDPLLGGTFFGKEDGVQLLAMDIDNQGYVYVTGRVNWPPDGHDVVIFKFNNSLTQLLGEAYLYGSSDERGMDIKIDASGNVFVAGSTASIDFPTTQGSLDVSHNDSLDIFVSKISSDFEYLLASTYIGGSGQDARLGLNIDIASNGDVVVSANVTSSDMPIFGNPTQPTNAGYDDAYIARLDNNLSIMTASTYLGGMYSDGPFAMHIGLNGDVYVSGHTWSPNFPHTSGSHHGGGTDAFISQLSSNLSQLKTSLFLGGTNGTWEYGCDFSQNSQGDIILAGATIADDFQPITSGVYQPTHGGNTDVFVTKFDQNLNVISSTYFGGYWDEGAYSNISCDIGPSNEIYIAGATESPEYQNFPLTQNGFDMDYNGGGDGFVSMLNSNLSNLLASTFYGGANTDAAYDLKIDNSGSVFICGTTKSADLPIPPNGYMPTKSNADSDGFVAKFDPYLSPGILDIYDHSETQKLAANLSVFPVPCSTQASITFTVEERAYVVVSIVDMAGKEVAVPIDNTLGEGDYLYNIQLSDYNIPSNQMYMVCLEMKNQNGVLTDQIKIIVSD